MTRGGVTDDGKHSLPFLLSLCLGALWHDLKAPRTTLIFGVWKLSVMCEFCVLVDFSKYFPFPNIIISSVFPSVILSQLFHVHLFYYFKTPGDHINDRSCMCRTEIHDSIMLVHELSSGQFLSGGRNI